MALFTLRRRRPPRVEESFERTLVSPLVLTHPGARAIYWSVFALLLLSTLVTFGPLYWMFSSALKYSIEIFQRPPVVYLIPQFVNISNLPLIHVSLINNWAGVWLPEAASALNILILKSFFDTIPTELTDAARLDGASPWQLFSRIILPLSRPALAVVTIFTVVASWKDFLWPLLVLFNPEVQPLSVAIYHEAGINSNFPLPFNYLMAGLVLASVPPILLFLLFQRQIIRGVNLTGLRG